MTIRLYLKKVLCPSLKICRGDFIHLAKKGRGDFILVVKNMGGIISTYTKMTRGDSIRGGFCHLLWDSRKKGVEYIMYFLLFQLWDSRKKGVEYITVLCSVLHALFSLKKRLWKSSACYIKEHKNLGFYL